MTLPTICVSRFSGPRVLVRVQEGWVPIRTTRGNPRYALPYKYRALGLLAPSREEFGMGNPATFAESYRSRMDEIGVEKITAELDRIIGDAPGGILLCFENLTQPGKWCHRSVFAQWWTDRTGGECPELDDAQDHVEDPLF